MNKFPGVSPRGDGFVAHPYNPATKQKKHLGTRNTPEEAYELVRKWQSGELGDRTIGMIVDLWLELHVHDRDSTLVDKTRNAYDADASALKREFGDEYPDDLYNRFEKVARVTREYSTGRVQAWNACLEWARNRRFCKLNPFQGAPARPQNKRAAKVVLDTEGVRELAQVALEVLPAAKGPTMAALIFAAYGTMLRPAHLFGLHGRDLDFVSNRITAPAVKRGQIQQVAMLPIAREGFELIPRALPEQLVFRNTVGNPMTKSILQAWFDPVRCAFGRPDLIFYDLKTAGVSRLVQAGANLADLAKQVTHADNGETLSRHYTELDIEKSLKAIEEIDSVATERELEADSVASRSQVPVGAAS